MAAISDSDLREKLETTRGGLANIRQPWEASNAEVARFTLRTLSPFIGQATTQDRVNAQTSPGFRANNRLYNSKAVRAHRTLMNGMSSGMSSPSQPWFKLKLADKELMDHHDVKVWLDDVQQALYDFLAATNVYQGMQAGYGELGVFGVEAGLFVPDWKYGAVFYPMTFGEYWLGQDYGLRIDTLYRKCWMTVGQMKAKFGLEKMSAAARKLYNDDKRNAMVAVMHAIEPNLEREYGKIDRTNKPWRSVYWEPGSDKGDGILAFEGFTRKPFVTPRWQALGTDPYSTGPGFDALPDSRKLQLQELRYQQAQDYLVRPPLQMPIGDMNRAASLIPGGITYTTSTDAAGARPLYQIDAAALGWMSKDIQERTEPAISEAFYEGLFMAITNMPGIQPRNVEEIIRRHQEQLSQLGPVVDRVQIEKLSVIVLQAFEIMAEAKVLPAVPKAMNGKEVSIEFTGVLAQAQKMMGLGAMERALGFIGNIAGIYPQITDKPDFDEAVDEYTMRLGVPARMLRPDEDVAAARAARAQQAQAAQQAAMAPALQQGAQAAQLLSETDVRGQSALERLLPQPGV